jgi:hypothetical protein
LSNELTQVYASLAVNSDALPINIAVTSIPPAANLKGHARSDFFASDLGMMIDECDECLNHYSLSLEISSIRLQSFRQNSNEGK